MNRLHLPIQRPTAQCGVLGKDWSRLCPAESSAVTFWELWSWCFCCETHGFFLPTADLALTSTRDVTPKAPKALQLILVIIMIELLEYFRSFTFYSLLLDTIVLSFLLLWSNALVTLKHYSKSSRDAACSAECRSNNSTGRSRQRCNCAVSAQIRDSARCPTHVP